MSKTILGAVLGVGLIVGALSVGDGMAGSTLDSIGTQAAEKMQDSAMDAAKSAIMKNATGASTPNMTSGLSKVGSSDIQNVTGGAVIDGVGTIPVGASVPDLKMQEVGTSQEVNTYAGTQKVMMRSCTTCHTAAPICAELGKKDASQWAVTVQKMVNLGAELAPSEQAAVTAYLAGEAPNSGPLCK